MPCGNKILKILGREFYIIDWKDEDEQGFKTYIVSGWMGNPPPNTLIDIANFDGWIVKIKRLPPYNSAITSLTKVAEKLNPHTSKTLVKHLYDTVRFVHAVDADLKRRAVNHLQQILNQQ